MNDRSDHPRSGSESAADHDYGSSSGLPRWLRIAGICALLLALVAVVALLMSGGEHGPSRHTSTGLSGSETSATGATDADGHQLAGGRR